MRKNIATISSMAILMISSVQCFQYPLTTGMRSVMSSPNPRINYHHHQMHPEKSKISLSSTTTSLSLSSSAPEESKCPVTKFSSKVSFALRIIDKYVLSRIIRIANHAPAFLSLAYFGLISMASMMSMGPMAAASSVNVSAAAAATSETTLSLVSQVLVRTVGSTTNAQFASAFPTLVTPASFVFLVWPIIATLQFITLTISALFPDKEEEILTQSDLSSLTLANLLSSAWLIASSNARKGNLPLASCLVLPVVPLISGYPLRNQPKFILWAFQVYSAFTTLASILAFTVEIQHGGRIPIIGKVGEELAALVFLGLYSLTSLAVSNMEIPLFGKSTFAADTESGSGTVKMEKAGAKKVVNFVALSGILSKRVLSTMATIGVGGWWGVLGSLARSISFWGTAGCWFWSLRELFLSKNASS